MTDRRFWWITLAVAGALIAIVNGEMFLGKVPFPSFFVFEWAPFIRAAPPGPLQLPANIGDIATSFYPFRTLAARAVRDGEIPLWNPYMLSGAPLLANAQSAPFYPLTFPYYLLPTPVAWGLAAILRLLLAILFTAAFVRHIGGTTTGAIAAGVSFAFCGFFTAWQGQSMVDAAIWLPLICLGIVRLNENPGTASVILCAVSLAMPVLAGHPETAVHTTLTAVALAAFLFATKPRAQFVLYFAAAALLSIGLASVQLLPTIEWVRYTSRSLSDSWPPHPLWSALAWVSRDILHSDSSFGLQIPEQAAYMGMLAFAAAPLAFFARSRKLVVFFAGWTAAVLSIAYGIGPLSWLSQHIPILQAVKNERFIFVASFGLAVLAGLGVSEIERWDFAQLRKYGARAAVLILAGGSIAMAMIYVLRIVTFAMAEPFRYPRVSAILLVLTALPLLLRLTGRLSGAPFRVALLSIVCADMVSFSYGFMPFTDPAHVFPRMELFERLPKPGKEPFRMAQIGGVYLANMPSMYGLSDVGGYEISLRRIKEFVSDLSENESESVRFLGGKVLAAKDRRLDMLNAKYLMVSDYDPQHSEFADQPDRFRFLYSMSKTRVYENLHALPAAFLVPASGVVVIPDQETAIQRIKDPAFDPRAAVVLETPTEMPGAGGSGNSGTPGTVEWLSRLSNSFELSLDAPQRSVLVVSQTFYPGWSAYVDGSRVPVVPADHALTGIDVPAGSHRVKFVFESPTFRIGLILSAATAAALLGLAVASRRSRFRPSASSSA